MADPIVVKVSELTELADLAAGDLITAVDVSEVISANKTKKLQVGNLKVFATAQLADSIVTVAKLADNAVTEAKLGSIKRTLVIRVTSPLDAVELVNYGGFFPWPVSLNNFIVVDARINLAVSGSTATTVVLSNQGGTMSTLTLASGATGLSASGAIAASYKTATTNGFLGVNVTAAGTGAKGLSITLVLQGVPQ